MAFVRRISLSGDGRSSSSRPVAALEELRRSVRSTELAIGSLACPACDAPVAPGARAIAITERMTCPYCELGGAVRDFLSLGVPTRPARVVVRVR